MNRGHAPQGDANRSKQGRRDDDARHDDGAGCEGERFIFADLTYAEHEALCARIRAKRRRGHRALVACGKVAAAILVFAVIATGVLVLRLQAGPIAIGGLGTQISEALRERFGGKVDFDLGQTSLRQRGFGPSLMTDRLIVRGPDHQVILSAPTAEVAIDPLALMFGRVSPKRLEVLDLTLRLVLLKNGALAIAAGEGTQPIVEVNRAAPPVDPAAPATASSRRAIVMQRAAAALRQFVDVLTDPASPIAAVDRLGITRGKLLIQDEMTGDEVVYSNLDLAFDKVRGVTNFTLAATGPNGRWSVSAMAQGHPGADRRFELQAQNFSIEELQLMAGTRSLGFETDMPVSIAADVALRPDNTLADARGRFALGSGYLRTEDPDQEPIFLKSFTGAVRWRGTERTIAVEQLAWREAGGTAFTGGGTVKPPLNEGEPWVVDLKTSEPGIFAPDRKGQEAIRLDEADLAGHLFLAKKTFLIDRFSARGPKGGLALSGSFDWANGPHVVLGARIAPTTVAFAQRVWPSFMAAPVRAWIINHFEGGLLSGGTVRVDYDEMALKRMRADRAPPDKSVALDFQLQDGRLRYLDGVPPIDHVQGVGHITGRTSHFTLTSGEIDVDGRKIEVTDGAFFVPNTNLHPTPAIVSAHLKGPVEAVTSILARDALKPYATLPVDASTLHGEIEGTLSKALLLGTKGDQAGETLKVNAEVQNLVADHLIGQESLEDAKLAIQVEDGKMKATGQGKIFGGGASFEIDQANGQPATAQIAVTLDDAARQRLGLTSVPGLSGPLTAKVNATLGDPAAMKAQVDLDLAKTTIAANYLGLNKPAGRPAKVSFLLQPRDNSLAIDQLVVDIGSLQARGAVDLGPDNGFVAAHFPSMKVSPGDDMRVDVTKADDGLKLTIRGSTIDARPFLKALTSTPPDDIRRKKEGDIVNGIDIDLKTGLLTGFNKQVLSGVELKMSRRQGAYRQFNVHGKFGRDAVSAVMAPNQRLRITAADAGALLSFIDLYKHMEGGQLVSNMTLDDAALTGNLEIHDFTLRDEPAIRSLVARTDTVSETTQSGTVRRIDAGAVPFHRLKVNFERAGSRVQLHDATMYGDEIGLSVEGWLDYVHNEVAMNGTFVPAYAFNNMFAQIPVFGAFLGGKSNEGLFAITFRISGAASSPSLAINPLSAIAPGFLRSIFGSLDGSGPSNAFETGTTGARPGGTDDEDEKTR